ncbi:alpha-amylase family glycosyl hydrolase [Rhodoferax sp.]|uniref:alpha-amylase family glycosyl hydrolase n=1 Tax=Rhodoferax sp. TaxID=50421 RepID=UPI003A102DF1
MTKASNDNWWRGGVIYQIYPRSFADSNGDGIGDLDGITAKLDYVAALGADGIWLSPFFKSPMKDFGYDVSDYCDVDPMFGTVADFRTLVDRAHALGSEGHDRPGALAQFRPAPLVCGEPLQPHQPQGRLVCVGRREKRRHAAQQLALHFWR